MGVPRAIVFAFFVSEQETPLPQATAKISSAATTTKAAVLITSFSFCESNSEGESQRRAAELHELRPLHATILEAHRSAKACHFATQERLAEFVGRGRG